MIVDPVAFAREFASRAHRHQLYGEQPYSYHLEQVAQLVAPIYRPMDASYDDMHETSRRRVQLMVIAYLHDVLEDTVISYSALVLMFDQHIADAVQLITDPKAHNRKERKRLLYDQISLAESELFYDDAVVVKVADRLANVISSWASKKPGVDWRYRMYQQEHPQFSLRLHRPGMCDSLWEQLNNRINVDDKER